MVKTYIIKFEIVTEFRIYSKSFFGASAQYVSHFSIKSYLI